LYVCVRDRYLVGSAITLADVAVFVALEQRGIAAAAGELAASVPHVVRWHSLICRSHKAFASVLTAVRP
jgi:glutathione S-transferase